MAQTIPFFVASVAVLASGQYVLDNSVGLGRKFDGIGGLSGGGVKFKSWFLIS